MRIRSTLVAPALALCVVGVGCSGDDDGGADPLGLGQDAAGTCLQFDEAVGAEVTELPEIDCAEPHSHEIYAVEEHPDSVYPGFDVLEEYAQQVCLAAFQPYVGIDAFDSSLFHSWLVPTIDGWNDEDDREILCILGSHDGTPLVGSMQGTQV